MNVKKTSRSLAQRDLEQVEPLADATNPARRSFFKGLGAIGVGSTAAMLFGELPLLKGQSVSANEDTANEILTAALIAEDLATTFYYNGLTQSGVIGDPALANGGTALSPGPNANMPNIAYLRAAFGQEIQHANLLRAVGNITGAAAEDPYQTFYFPASTFSNLANFIATLSALENAFIGAYMNAIRQFSMLASRSAVRGVPKMQPGASEYSSAQLSYYAEVAASIMGVECEHRVLGPVITNTLQPNNLNYEQTDGLKSMYHGSVSAVAALTPFLTPSTGPSYSLSAALSASASLSLASSGNPPNF